MEFDNINNQQIKKQRQSNLFNLHLSVIEPYIIAFFLFFLIPPFYFWQVPQTFIALICFLLFIRHIKFKNQVFILLFFVVFIAYLYISYKQGLSFAFLSILTIPFLFFVPKSFLLLVFKAFIRIYSLTLIPSIIIFVLVYYFKINIEHSIIEPLNELKSYNYFKYPFLVHPNSALLSLLPRFHGYYDEPGVVGTISALILISSGFNLKEKINIPILISGIISFSFAFFASLAIYALIFARLRYKIMAVIASLIVIIFLSNNEFISDYVIQRFSIEDGKLAGDNRTRDSFDAFFDKFLGSTDFYFGLGYEKSKAICAGGSSYKITIVRYGIVFFIAFIGIMVLNALYSLRFNKYYLIYLFILFMILYQRPYITNFFYMFLLLAPVSYLYNNYIKKKGTAIQLSTKLEKSN